ncbi:hypothetical protein KPJ13_25815, partial [Escherichia coli]|nr:hypothetical protein [Escherichia coli]
VPAYGPQNDVTLKMPAFEWVHVQLHQQKGMISLSPPTICNSAGDFELLLCHGTVCVVGKIRDLILQLSKSSIYSTKPVTALRR